MHCPELVLNLNGVTVEMGVSLLKNTVTQYSSVTTASNISVLSSTAPVLFFVAALCTTFPLSVSLLLFNPSVTSPPLLPLPSVLQIY